MKLGLRRKLIRAYALILFLMVALALVNLYTTTAIQKRLHHELELSATSAHSLARVSTETGLVRANTLLHLQAFSTDDMEVHASEIARGQRAIGALFDTLAATLQIEVEQQKLAEFQFAWDLYSGIVDEHVLPASTARRKEEALSFVREGGAASMAARAAYHALEELQTVSATQTGRHLTSAASLQRTSQGILLAITILSAVPILAFAAHLTSQIVDPIDLISDAAQLVASGDVDWTVTLETGDELEALAESLNVITRSMRKTRAAKRETTEHLQQETHQRRHAQQVLSTERERLAATLDSMGDAVITTDTEGRITLINNTAARLTGWSQAEAAGKPLANVLHILDEPTGATLENTVESALTLGGDARLAFGGGGPAQRTILVTRGGTRRRITCSSAPVRDANGRPGGVFLIFRTTIAKQDGGVLWPR